MLGFGLYIMCRLLILLLMTVLFIRTAGVIVLFRYTHSTVSAAPHWVPASLLSKANWRLAFASALLMCVFQVCIFIKGNSRVCCTVCVFQRYFHGFDLVEKVKNVVKDLVFFFFTDKSCAQLYRMLVRTI